LVVAKENSHTCNVKELNKGELKMQEKEAYDYNYEIADSGHSFRLHINDYGIAEIYYEHERVNTPVTKEKAEELINMLKCLVETEYPIDSIDLSDYDQGLLGKLIDSLKEDDDEDDEDGSSTSFEQFMKLMMLKSMMD